MPLKEKLKRLQCSYNKQEKNKLNKKQQLPKPKLNQKLQWLKPRKKLRKSKDKWKKE